MKRSRLRVKHILQSRIVLFSYWAFCFALTHLPPTEVPTPLPPGVDKFVHAIIYFILAFLFFRSKGVQVDLRGALRIFLILLAYAVVDEITQDWVGRETDALDGLADMGGVSIAVLWELRKARRK